MPTDASAPVLDVAGILRDAGLMPLELTRAETTCADETPGIGWALFCKTFGGGMRTEWPLCSNITCFVDFLCADITVQPYMPLDIGKAGLVLRLPSVAEVPQTNKSTYHVFSTMPQGGTLRYRGKYTKISLPHLQFKWEDLPRPVCTQKSYYTCLLHH